MRLISTATAGLFAVTAAVLIAGCTSSDGGGAPAPAPAPATTTDSDHADGHGEHADHGEHGDHGEHADHAGGGDMEKMKAGLAKLSDEDRAAAEKQHMCPVSDKMLGTMGAPIKLTLNDTDVWLCCEGCRKAAEDDPDAIVAKLSK